MKYVAMILLSIFLSNFEGIPKANPVDSISKRSIDTAKMVALTFDDGPSIETTSRILDLLEQYDIPATFFLVGQNISESNKEVVARAHKIGCEIANHSWSHSRMSQMSKEQIEREVKSTSERIYQITGEYPKYFRPPYLDVGDEMFNYIDLIFIGGFGQANDYYNSVDAKFRETKILEIARTQRNPIVLLHDFGGNQATVDALKNAIPILLKEGYSFVTLSELFEYANVTPRAGDGVVYNSPYTK